MQLRSYCERFDAHVYVIPHMTGINSGESSDYWWIQWPSLLFNIFILLVGIGLARLKKWAQRLTAAVAIVGILFSIASAGLSYVIISNTSAETLEHLLVYGATDSEAREFAEDTLAQAVEVL